MNKRTYEHSETRSLDMLSLELTLLIIFGSLKRLLAEYWFNLTQKLIFNFMNLQF